MDRNLSFPEIGRNLYAIVRNDDYQYQLGTIEWDAYDEEWHFEFCNGCSILTADDIKQMADFFEDVKVIIKKEE